MNSISRILVTVLLKQNIENDNVALADINTLIDEQRAIIDGRWDRLELVAMESP